ncbi:MAG: DUF952 domain-containing protein [Pseudomonadota bacterium]
MTVYKLLTAPQMAAFRCDRSFGGAPVDLADGFVHLSAADQLAGTAAKHFRGVAPLWLAAFGQAALGAALRWEPSRGGALFPHLYAPLRLADMEWAVRLELAEDGTPLLPPGLLP